MGVLLPRLGLGYWTNLLIDESVAIICFTYLVIQYILPNHTRIHIETSTTIQAPIENVFELVANYTNWPRIVPHIKSVKQISEQEGQSVLEIQERYGMKHYETLKILRNRIENEMRLWTKRSSEVWTYETSTEGTRVTLAADWSFRGIHSKNGLARLVERNIMKTLTLLKEIAEAKPACRATKRHLTAQKHQTQT